MKYARLVRGGKCFRFGDLILYGAVLLLTAALFLSAALLSGGTAEGFCVEREGARIYTYRFGEGGEVAPAWRERIGETREGALLIVRIETEDGWNELAVDDAAKTARMRDADCSRRKDCCAMQPLGGGGSVIVCIPHGIRVMPLSGEDLSHPAVG